MAIPLSEGNPASEDAVLVVDGSTRARFVSGQQSRLEVSNEAMALGRCTSCHGYSCG